MLRHSTLLALSALALAGCPQEPTPTPNYETPDSDGDGQVPLQDCNDFDETVYDGAPELCDGKDNDCDGQIDEAVTDIYYADVDGDGFGDADNTADVCTKPEGYVHNADDCDDGDENVNPTAIEFCNGYDDDCDDDVDEDDAENASTWYADADDDGYGDPAVTSVSCHRPVGFVDDDSDCDDGQDESNPGLTETCGDGIDNDCDGTDNGCTPNGSLDLSRAEAKLVGSRSDMAGASLAALSESTGDRFGDVLVGAPGAAVGGVSGGAAYVLAGELSNGSLTTSWTILAGDNDDDWAGAGVGNAGDVDGDGFDDLLIGAWGYDGASSDVGAAYLVTDLTTGTSSLSDAATLFLVGVGEGDAAGYAVAGAGDTDGDGVLELAIGAPFASNNGGSSGSVYLVSSSGIGEVSLSTGVRIDGEGAGDRAGASVVSAGDTDGDGMAELLIGAYGNDDRGEDSGAAYVLAGPLMGTINLGDASKLIGETVYDSVGSSVAGVGDMDADGYDDVLVGAYREGTGGNEAGAAYLVLGPIDGSLGLADATAKILGEAAGDWVGTSLTGAGDTNGDGQLDLVVGAPGQSTGGPGAGASYLVLGPVIGSRDLGDAQARFVGETIYDGAGTAVAGATDVDGDGLDDILVGAPHEDSTGDDNGAIYLILGGGR